MFTIPSAGLLRGAVAGAGVLVVVFSAAMSHVASSFERALAGHISQSDIDAGVYSARDLFVFGHHLFVARFTRHDGVGRPGATGSGLPTRRPLVGARDFLRTSGPDASSCAGCHHQPFVGGGGEFASNVFVGAQEREPVLFSISQQFSAERGTPDLFGAGLIELLAREMTHDLHEIRNRAIADAERRASVRVRRLRAKSVDFGTIKAYPWGEVDTSGVRGVDRDLVVRPWSQKGVVTSLRSFTVTAFNHHHGMQAEERFGVIKTGAADFDRDGVEDELTSGDITAVTLFQAMLPPPRFVLSRNAEQAERERQGERLFAELGCTRCHIARMVLRSGTYAEPGPWNLEGTLQAVDVEAPFAVDLLAQPGFEHLRRTPDGGVVVSVLSDLRRHVIADREAPFFANEIVSQGFAPTDQFIARRLWATGNTDPYGHRGDVTTVDEAIRHHGGDAAETRLAYEALSVVERWAVVSYLRAWVVPDIEMPNAEETRDVVARVSARWQAELGRRTATVRTLTERVASARRRAARQVQRSRVHSLRIAQELRRAESAGGMGVVSSVDPEAGMVTVDELPYLGRELAELLEEEGAVGEPGTVVGGALREFADEVAVVEGALRELAEIWAGALSAARFAHAGEADVAYGSLGKDGVLREVASAVRRGDLVHALRQVVAWAEDQTFRAEQIAQQIAVAATRAEAEAERAVGGR